jgi:nucleotide-binding universal stress UspA family protein
VAAAAEREGADLVLCGTRGLTGFSRLLLGSTARGIVQRVRVPVLTVHPGDRSPLEATRVLLATDFSDDAARAADALARLLAGRIAEVEVVLAHVCHLPAVVAWLLGGEEGARPLLAELDQGARDSLASVEASLAEKGLRVLTEVREGDPAEVLVGLTREREVGLVAMGTRGHARVRRLLLGRTADRVIQHASCPVLTVRRDES